MNPTEQVITLDDLKLVQRLIDVVSVRGAIKPTEMKVIGELYSKLELFVAAATPAETKPSESAELTEQEEGTE